MYRISLSKALVRHQELYPSPKDNANTSEKHKPPKLYYSLPNLLTYLQNYSAQVIYGKFIVDTALI